MKKSLCVLAALGALAWSVAWARESAAAPLEHRWVYLATNLLVDKNGQVAADHTPISFPDLLVLLNKRHQANTNLPVYITGTRDATHGSVVYVLDFVKRAGIQRVAIAVKAAPDQPNP